MITLQYTGLLRYAIPTHEGVYAFRDSSGAYIYIGIGKNLRSRLWTHIKRTGGAERLYQYMANSADLDLWAIDVYGVADCVDRTDMKEYWAVRGLEKRLVQRHNPPCNYRLTNGDDGWELCTAICHGTGWHTYKVMTCDDSRCDLCNQGYGHSAKWCRLGSTEVSDHLTGEFAGWVVPPHAMLNPPYLRA